MIRYFFSCTRLLMIVFSVCSLFICTLMVRLSFWWAVPPVLRFVFLSLCKVSMNSQPWLLLACCFSLLLLASCFGLCFVWTVLLFMSWLYASTCKLSTLFSDYFYFSSVFIVYYDIFRQLRDNLQIMVMEQRISQRDILRRSPVALSDIIPQQKRAHPCGAFFAL